MGIRRSHSIVTFITLSAAAALGGCHTPHSPATGPAPLAGTTTLQSGPPLFTDVARQAGINFTHSNGATGAFHAIENTPGGCAFLDYDGDGFTDILLVQSGSSEPFENVNNRVHCALYHNNGNGTFTDVTAGSGLDTDLGYLQGVTVGDYDNDGYPDIFLTGYGGSHLLHNSHGTGKFTDVTHVMGLDNFKGYATSAAFGDYDNDGRLDLYVCGYIKWTWKTDLPCSLHSIRDYCSPDVYMPETHHLYHNEGSRFVDVSAKAGINKATGRGLAVAFVDVDNTGRQDIFVANDLNANLLWHNNGDGTFTESAAARGCAFDESGALMSGMGIGVADYDHSGRDSLFVSNFSQRANMLYRNVGGMFEDQSYTSGLAAPHLQYLAFGCDFMDYDADGWEDLFVVNGHVQVLADKTVVGSTLKERKQLFHNTGKRTFTEVTDSALLGELGRPTISRGMAVGDFDNDGRLDVLVSNQNEPAQLFRNMDRSGHHWISFLTIGTKSNREGRHARFTVMAGGMRQTGAVRAGSSYLSHSDRRVYFGLGAALRTEHVEVRWPSGAKDELKDLAADRIYVVTEGKGVTGTLPSSKTWR